MRRFGAREFRFDIDSGVATFLPERDSPFDVRALGETVEEAGFELLWLELEVAGALSGNGQVSGADVLLTVAGSGQGFALHPGESERERREYARLIQWLDQPRRRFIVRGRADVHQSSPPVLSVLEFRMESDPGESGDPAPTRG